MERGETERGETERGETDRAERFDDLYERQYGHVCRYLARRAPAGLDPEDLAAEVFTVAWRRLDDVPLPPADRWWLYSVARRQLGNAYRGGTRRRRLEQRVATQPPAVGAMPGDDVESADAVRALLGTLREADREVLLLVLWEQLSHAEAGAVLGCTANAVAVRYHRALKRLRAAIDAAERTTRTDVDEPEEGGQR